MKNKILFRGLLGAPVGVCITTLISIIISLIHNDGVFYAAVPEFVAVCENELEAVIIQTVCALLYGGIFGGASVIWDIESWSILRMTLTHLLIISLSTLPIAWIVRWMPHSVIGVVLYFLMFFGVYAVIWVSQYAAIKRQVKKMNEKITVRSDK